MPLDWSKVDDAKAHAAFLSQFHYRYVPLSIAGELVPKVELHCPGPDSAMQSSALHTLSEYLGVPADYQKQAGNLSQRQPLEIVGKENVEKLLNLPIENAVLHNLRDQLGIKASNAVGPDRFRG